MHPLEHFYYGQFVRRGEPEGELRLLAKSAGVAQSHVADALRAALIPPLTGVPDGSWALLRGQKVPFILVQAGIGAADQTMLHFIFMPPDVLRTIAGNISTLLSLLHTEWPTYDRLGDELMPLTLQVQGTADAQTQIGNLLELMTLTGNRIQNIEHLLGALVQGLPIVVYGAPKERQPRARFIEGMLTLLPPSARFSVTFATHTQSATRIEAQIRFVEDKPPAGTVVFHWPQNKLLGDSVERNEYSRFITSQLRLDPQLVIEQNTRLTAVAGWRLRRGDRLVDALSYASYRLKLDDALQNNLPVEIAEVSRILAEDPTLTDALRSTYANHLVRFSLALDDMQHADPIAITLRNDPRLEQTVHAQLSEALQNGKAHLIFETLLRWLSNPLGPSGRIWIDLIHQAALAYVEELLARRDMRAVHAFIDRAIATDESLSIGRIVPSLVEKLVPLIQVDKTLAERLFILAAYHLETERLRRLLTSKIFVQELPRSVAVLMAYISGAQHTPPPPGTLYKAATVFGDEHAPMVLIRFVGMADDRTLIHLLDADALRGLLNAALSERGATYAGLLFQIVRTFNRDQRLKELGSPGTRVLLQLLLALGEYEELAHQMKRHARVLYPGDLMLNYLRAVQAVFAGTPMPAEKLRTALTAINKHGIIDVPYLCAAVGALEASGWSPNMRDIADFVADGLFNTPRYLSVIQPEAVFTLLRYYAEQQATEDAIKVAALIPSVAANMEDDGLPVISRMYQAMNWDERARAVALDLLRRFVREADDREARQAVTVFGKELGREVQRKLDVTYRVNALMGGVGLVDYARFLETVGTFLHDCATAYADKSNSLSFGALLAILDRLKQGLSRLERTDLAEVLITMARMIAQLGAARQMALSQTGILTGKDDPKSALDVFRAMGGYFAGGKRYNVDLTARGEPNPFIGRSAEEVKDTIELTHDVLQSILKALPPDIPVPFTIAELRDELRSMWDAVAEDQRKDIHRTLAVEFQRIPYYIHYMTEQGDIKALMPDSSLGKKIDRGKHKPKSTLEMFRFIYNYLLTAI